MRRVRVLPVALLALGAVAAAVVIAANGATVRKPAPATPFYGVGLSKPATALDYTRMAAGGVRTARFVINWAFTQPHADSGYHWGQVDGYMRGLAKHGLEPVPLLFASPAWATRSYLDPPIGSRQARSAWRAFVRAAVARFGPHGSFWAENPTVPYDPIRYWQIWNEQNSPGFYGPKPSPSGYAQLLKMSANALRRVDPGAKVVLGGMFEGNVKNGAIIAWKYLSKLYRIGAARYFDVVGAHPYSPTMSGYEFQLRKLAATIRHHGDRGTPIWIDEIGWGSGRPGTSPLNKGLKGQARMLRRAFGFAARNRGRLGLQRILWYPWRDAGHTPPDCAFCGKTGLRLRNGKAKPSWRAFRHIAAG